MKKHNDLSDTPITQVDIDNGKLKLVKRKTDGQLKPIICLAALLMWRTWWNLSRNLKQVKHKRIS